MDSEGGAAPVPARLSNGITLINAPMSGALTKNVTVSVVVRHGPRDEATHEAGLIETLEALFVTGTTNRPDTDALLIELDNLGVYVKSDVHTDHSTFKFTGKATDLEKIAEIVGDLVCNPGNNPNDIERARQINLDGVDSTDLDAGSWTESHLHEAVFAKGSAMARSDLPSRDVIATVSHKRLASFRDRVFNPSSIAVVVAGNASLDIDTANKYFGSLTATPPMLRRTRARWRHAGDPWVGNIRTGHADDRPNVKFRVAIPGLMSNDADRNAYAMMSSVLGGSDARLFNKVRGELGLVYGIYSRPELYEDTGLLVIYAECHPDNAAQALQVAFEELRELAGSNPTTNEELTRAQLSTGFSIDTKIVENSSALASWYGQRWAMGRPLELPSVTADQYTRVTTQDLTRVAGRLLPGVGKARFVFDGPRDQGKELAAAIADSGGKSL